jgi:hypothetical protein
MNFVCSTWHLESVNEIHGWVSSTNHHQWGGQSSNAECGMRNAEGRTL